MKRDFYFDVEIISKINSSLEFNGCQIALVKRYRGIDLQTLKGIIDEIKSQEAANITINIRGVNY